MLYFGSKFFNHWDQNHECQWFCISGMVIVDSAGNLAAGTSTNGANHKIAG